eukprot:1096249-Amphidinium_carterae.2
MARGSIPSATKANLPHFIAKSSPSTSGNKRKAGTIQDRTNKAAYELSLDAERSARKAHDTVQS